jgi:hypothetical protein
MVAAQSQPNRRCLYREFAVKQIPRRALVCTRPVTGRPSAVPPLGPCPGLSVYLNPINYFAGQLTLRTHHHTQSVRGRLRARLAASAPCALRHPRLRAGDAIRHFNAEHLLRLTAMSVHTIRYGRCPIATVNCASSSLRQSRRRIGGPPLRSRPAASWVALRPAGRRIGGPMMPRTGPENSGRTTCRSAHDCVKLQSARRQLPRSVARLFSFPAQRSRGRPCRVAVHSGCGVAHWDPRPVNVASTGGAGLSRLGAAARTATHRQSSS